jgi:hypothetical protein
MSINPLLKQLEDQRFLKAIHIVQQAAGGIKKLGANELAHLNRVLTDSDDEPWRFESTQVRLPSGRVHDLNLLSNPILKAREIVGDSLQMAGNGDAEKAGLHIYIELVLAHVFSDANRRTAVLATTWVLALAGKEVDAEKLLKIPLGDLRDPKDREAFSTAFKLLIS